jgi:A/G-specific adenine glycosylase
MVDIVPEHGMKKIDSGGLFRWYDRAWRGLPSRRPDVTAWAGPGQRVHAAAGASGPGGADLAAPGGALHTWGKLGYPRRAKRLHECATVIATEYRDVVADCVEPVRAAAQ